MSFPHYPEYKDSGVEWLGKVPKHWDIPLIKHTTYLKARVGWKGLTSEEFKEHSFAYLITGSDFREKYVKWDTCYQVERERYEDDPFIQLKNGDLLVTKDGTIGKLAIVSDLNRPACLNSGIFVVRPLNTYTTEFMYWILSSRVFSVFCDLGSFGSTINHLYQNVFERFAFPAPSEFEQAQIAAFLERETAKIDALVAEQRRLMELLKEKRQAVISHAVIRGLNPAAPMKPSGIEWLGDVPAHWDISHVKRVASIRYGIGEPPKYHPEGVPLIRATNVHAGKLFDEGMVFVDPAEIPAQRIVWLASGDIVVVRSGAYTGDSAIIPASYGKCIAGFDMVLRCHTANPAFVQFVLLSKYLKEGQIDLEKMRAAQPHLNAEELGRCVLALPAAQEQEEIVEFLKTESAKFDTLTTEAQRAIDLLQERRTALIAAAVTGQIDVRGAV